MQDDDGFDKAFQEGVEVEEPTTPPVDPPKDDPVQEGGGKDDPEPTDPKKPEEPTLEEPKKTEEETPPASDEGKPPATPKPPEDPEAPPTPPAEEPKPLTRDDVTSILTDIRSEERNSGKEVETATEEVMKAYYPDGVSNVLIDKTSGKELKSPQDVVDVTNGQMGMEEAAQWLMNEQFKLDQDVKSIKDDARRIAENTISFKRDSINALKKYEPLFKWQPSLQKKVFDRLMSQVKADDKKGVILSAPDVMDHYDFYLEPYQQAYEYSQNKPATNPVPSDQPPAPKPSAEDRMDDGGDAGATPPNDPNDFAQQVKKELAKGI